MALKQRYERLSTDYDQPVKWSWTLDQGWVMIHVQPLFGRTVPVTTSLLLLQLRR
jgi:hypothetical protein